MTGDRNFSSRCFCRVEEVVLAAPKSGVFGGLLLL